MDPNNQYQVEEQLEPTVLGPESRWQKVKPYLMPFMFMGIVALVLVGLEAYDARNIYQKPKVWVISQSLNSALSKQNKILGAVSGGQVSLGDLVEIATESSEIKAKVVKQGNDYLLSTGANGEVSSEIIPGTYKIQLAKIPEIDFTGVPAKITIDRVNYLLNIGLAKGNGKVRAGNGFVATSGSGSKLNIRLFQDKNGNGVKDSGENTLPWAGVVVKLVKE